MKKVLTISGFMLVALLAGSGCHNQRHDKGDRKDMGRHAHMETRNGDGMKRMLGNNRLGRENGSMRDMGPGMGMMGGRHPGMGMGKMNRGGRMPMDSLGWMPAGPGRRILESIPDVTENQKNQIGDLMKKHHDEMSKIREEMNSKLQKMIETHRRDILNILTEEQKKFIESGYNKPIPSPERAK